jgi:6-phospho-beta-glucosidase
MKIAVIGGGSTYTPELVNGFLKRVAILPLDELWLMDIDSKRLAIVGGFAKRMAEAKDRPFKVILTGDRRAALEGASYVVTQIRVGQMPARRADEYLGRRHGLIGQETTGVGGMANALRTIPVILDIAADIHKYAPGALLLNFANPSGLVTEALFRYAPDVRAIGVCNVGITAKMEFLELLERTTGEKASSDSAELKTLGLNHLTWHSGFAVNGVDRWPTLFPAFLHELAAEKEPEWDRGTLEALGMVPNYYLQYFYYTAKKLAEEEKWPPSRAETVMEIEKELLARYADPALVEPPPELMKRGGAYYSELATRVIADHHNDSGGVHVVNVRNDGAVPEWPADWVLELPARVDARGAHPLTAKALPPAQFALVSAVKMYELLTAEAAIKGDRRSVYEAILAHPLGPAADKIGDLVEDLLSTNKAYLPRFFA